MQEIIIKVYSFEELSEDAKKVAINNYEPYTDYMWEEGEQTSRAFCNAFGIKTNNWLEPKFSHIDDHILQLSGLRLRKYLLNNFYSVF